jgi:hypothetical protein
MWISAVARSDSAAVHRPKAHSTHAFSSYVSRSWRSAEMGHRFSRLSILDGYFFPMALAMTAVPMPLLCNSCASSCTTCSAAVAILCAYASICRAYRLLSHRSAPTQSGSYAAVVILGIVALGVAARLTEAFVFRRAISQALARADEGELGVGGLRWRRYSDANDAIGRAGCGGLLRRRIWGWQEMWVRR